MGGLIIIEINNLKYLLIANHYIYWYFIKMTCCLVTLSQPGATLKSLLIKNGEKKLAFQTVLQLALDLARGSIPSPLLCLPLFDLFTTVWYQIK